MTDSGISVVTVVKDDPVGLRKTMASVCEQLDKPEFIIVDGASEGAETIEVLKEAERTGARVLSEPDRNCYEAMNKGWRRASSDAVAFLNAGDVYATRNATKVLATLSEGHRWGYGALRIVGPGGSSSYRFEPFRQRLLALGIKYVPHPASVVPVQLLEDLGGFDEEFGIAADQLLFMRLSRLARPRLSREVIATFSLGGLSTRSPEEIAHDFHRARLATNSLVGGSDHLDALAGRVIATGRRAFRGLRRG